MSAQWSFPFTCVFFSFLALVDRLPAENSLQSKYYRTSNSSLNFSSHTLLSFSSCSSLMYCSLSRSTSLNSKNILKLGPLKLLCFTLLFSFFFWYCLGFHGEQIDYLVGEYFLLLDSCCFRDSSSAVESSRPFFLLVVPGCFVLFKEYQLVAELPSCLFVARSLEQVLCYHCHLCCLSLGDSCSLLFCFLSAEMLLYFLLHWHLCCLS